MRILSLDVPWAAANYVGAAYAEICGGQLVAAPLVTSVRSAFPNGAAGISIALSFPKNHPEVAGFINDGAGPSRARPEDFTQPAPNFPTTPLERETYLEYLWRAFEAVRQNLSLTPQSVDFVLVDMPTVPALIAATAPNLGKFARYRPLEIAFGQKVMIPGAAAARTDGRIQFSRFQAASINGCRPAYAVFQLALEMFGTGGAAVAESFPQLVLGPLAEYAQSHALPLLRNLASHKSGRVSAIPAGQQRLADQVDCFVGVKPSWIPNTLTAKARGDGWDALLGLLPGLVHHGWTPAGSNSGHWQKAILIKNLPAGPVTTSNGAGTPATGCRAWIDATPTYFPGINDAGILTLGLSLWG